MRRKMCIYKCMLNVYKNQQIGKQESDGSKNASHDMGYLYEACDQISNLCHQLNSCWEKCDEKCPYMFNVYKNQQSRQTGSRNLTGPKTLPTIWYTYKISAINSYWEKCDEKYLGRTDRGKTVYPPPPSGSGGINSWNYLHSLSNGLFWPVLTVSSNFQKTNLERISEIS